MEKIPAFSEIEGLHLISMYRNNTFIGRCYNFRQPLVAAMLKFGVNEIRYMFRKQNLEHLKHLMYEVKDVDEYYKKYKEYLFVLPKRVKDYYVRENARGRYNKFDIISIKDRRNRIVFDEKEKCYFNLHEIPRGEKCEIIKVKVSEHRNLFGRNFHGDVYMISCPCEVPFPFLKNADYKVSRDCDIHVNYYDEDNTRKAVKELEKIGFLFKKNALYNNIKKLHK